MKSGAHICGRFERDGVGKLLACIGIDTQATCSAPVREGARVYVCTDSAEADVLRSLLVGFGVLDPVLVAPMQFAGVFHDGHGGFEFFAPVPDHSGDLDGLCHG